MFIYLFIYICSISQIYVISKNIPLQDGLRMLHVHHVLPPRRPPKAPDAISIELKTAALALAWNGVLHGLKWQIFFQSINIYQHLIICEYLDHLGSYVAVPARSFLRHGHRQVLRLDKRALHIPSHSRESLQTCMSYKYLKEIPVQFLKLLPSVCYLAALLAIWAD